MEPNKGWCVVFDFDGTLVASNAIKRCSYFHAARCLGQVDDIVSAVLAGARGGDRYALLRAVAERAQEAGRLSVPAGAGSLDSLTAELVRRYTRCCEQAIVVCDEVRGAMSALDALHGQGQHLFINSATPGDTLSRIVRARGLGRYFHGVYGRPTGKTDNLAAILQLSGCQPDTTVVVGDGEDDRLAAESVACHFVGIIEPAESETSPRRQRFRAEPEHRLPDLVGLPALIATL